MSSKAGEHVAALHLQAQGCPTRSVVLAVVAIIAVVGSAGGQKAPPATPKRDVRTSAISGVVRDTAGATIAGALVSADGAVLARTDPSGEFNLSGLPRGPMMLVLMRLGFEPDSVPLQLGDEPLTLNFRLTPIPHTLPPVHVRAPTEPFNSRLEGFNSRRARKLGYYITRDEIEQRSDRRLVDALRRVPGVRVYTMGGALGRSVTMAGSRCPPLIMVDGFPASLGSFDLDMVDLTTVEGIEIYPNGSSVPSELTGPRGMENCGLIAIWSAPMRPNRRANQAIHPIDVAALLRSGAVYPADSVEVQARYVANSARPEYPDSLLKSQTSGHVVARFVVDTLGEVESGTVAIVSSSNSGFDAAVRAAVPGAVFKPARRGGRPVRSVVELPFEFDPSAPAP